MGPPRVAQGDTLLDNPLKMHRGWHGCRECPHGGKPVSPLTLFPKTLCYRLDVSDLPKFLCYILIPCMTICGGRATGRQLSHKRKALMDQMHALIKEVQELPCPFCHVRLNGKAPSINVILGFPGPRVVSNTFLLLGAIIATRMD